MDTDFGRRFPPFALPYAGSRLIPPLLRKQTGGECRTYYSALTRHECIETLNIALSTKPYDHPESLALGATDYVSTFVMARKDALVRAGASKSSVFRVEGISATPFIYGAIKGADDGGALVEMRQCSPIIAIVPIVLGILAGTAALVWLVWFALHDWSAMRECPLQATLGSFVAVAFPSAELLCLGS